MVEIFKAHSIMSESVPRVPKHVCLSGPSGTDHPLMITPKRQKLRGVGFAKPTFLSFYIFT